MIINPLNKNLYIKLKNKNEQFTIFFCNFDYHSYETIQVTIYS